MDPILEQKRAAVLAAFNDYATYASAHVTAPAAPPAPPPPAPTPTPAVPGTFPNDQTNLPLLSDQPFDAVSGQGWFLNGEKRPELVDDPSAPISPPRVLQFTYPLGFAGGSAPATVATGLGGRRTLYAGFAFKASAGWQGHNSNVNKLAHVFLADSGGEAYLCFYGEPGGPYHLRTNLQFRGSESRWLLPNRGTGLVTVGAWHVVEWYLEYAARAVVFAIDGSIVGEHRDISFPGAGLAEFQFSPTWGGMGDMKQHVDTLRIDHARIRGV